MPFLHKWYITGVWLPDDRADCISQDFGRENAGKGTSTGDNFAVKQHLQFVEKFSDLDSYFASSYEDTLHWKEEVAPLLLPDDGVASAVRFDALMYGIELAYLVGKKYTRARSDLITRVSEVAGVANIPEI